VPRSRKKLAEVSTADLRQLVGEAADALDSHGEAGLAAAVRTHLDRTAYVYTGDKPTLPLYIRTTTWTRAQAGTAAEGSSIEQAVENGFEEFLAGRFRPEPQPRGSGAGKATKSTRARQSLREQVAYYAADHADEIGWHPSPGQVAALWLEHLYGETP
jgi:hypothetical protein